MANPPGSWVDAPSRVLITIINNRLSINVRSRPKYWFSIENKQTKTAFIVSIVDNRNWAVKSQCRCSIIDSLHSTQSNQVLCDCPSWSHWPNWSKNPVAIFPRGIHPKMNAINYLGDVNRANPNTFTEWNQQQPNIKKNECNYCSPLFGEFASWKHESRTENIANHFADSFELQKLGSRSLDWRVAEQGTRGKRL